MLNFQIQQAARKANKENKDKLLMGYSQLMLAYCYCRMGEGEQKFYGGIP